MPATTRDPSLGASIVENMQTLREDAHLGLPADPLYEDAALENRKPKPRKERASEYGREGWLHPQFWIPLPGDDNWRARDSPSESLEAFFSLEGRVSSATAAKAAVAQGLREAMGDEAFDDQLDGLIIGRVNVGPLGDFMRGKEENPAGEADLLPGDLVHLSNPRSYQFRHPGGPWDEVSSIYAGGGEYETHGVGRTTLADLRGFLADAFNEQPDGQESEVIRGHDFSGEAALRAEQITADDVTVWWDHTERVSLKPDR